MGRRMLVATALAAGLALVPSAAGAKGAKEMTLVGPGLATPIRLANTLEVDVSPNRIAATSGLFQAPDRYLARRPPGELGPRYDATYQWLTGANETTPLRQELYPFADGGPVTYTPREQRLTEFAPRGGWYRAGVDLTLLLVAAGVPVPVGYAASARVAADPRLTG